MLVLFVGCLAFVAGRGDDSKEAADTKGGDETPTVSIGEPLTVGEVTWTITGAQQTSQLVREGPTPKNTKTEEGNYVIVDFSFTNNGSEAVTLDNESLRLVDSEGRESGTRAEHATYVPEDRRLFLERINPGVTEEGQAIFEVAPDASGFRVLAGDAKPFTNVEGYVDLGF